MRIHLILLIFFCCMLSTKSYSQYPDSIQIMKHKIKQIKVYYDYKYDKNKSKPLNIINYTYFGKIADSIYNYDNGYRNRAKRWFYDNTSNRLIKKEELKYSNKEWIIEETCLYDYDSIGDLINYSLEATPIGGPYSDFPSYSIKYYYDNGKRIAREKKCIQDYSYDDKGRLIEISDRKKRNRKKVKLTNNKSICGVFGSGLKEEVFLYYKDSIVHQRILPWNGRYELNEKIIYNYDNNIIGFYEYHRDGISKFYEYDEMKRLEKISEWRTGSSSYSIKRPNKTISFIYDEKDRLGSKVYINEKTDYGETEIYEYNEKDLVNRITYYERFNKIKTFIILYEYFE